MVEALHDILIEPGFPLKYSLVVLLCFLKLVPSRNQIAVHDALESAGNALERALTEPHSKVVFIDDVVRGFRPGMVKDGLHLDFTTETRELRVLWQSCPVLVQPYRVVNRAIAQTLVLGKRMMHLGGVFLDVEVVTNQA